MKWSVLPLLLLAGCAGTRKAPEGGELPATDGVTLIAGRQLSPTDVTDGALLARLGAPGQSGRTHVILRLRHGLRPDAFRELDAQGVRLVHYLGRDYHAASVRLPFDPGIPAFRGSIEWVGVYEIADKLHPEFGGGPIEPWYLNDRGEVRALVVFFADVPGPRAEQILEDDGWRTRTTQGVGRAWLVEGDVEQLKRIRRHDEVNLLRPAPPPPGPSAAGPLEVTHSEDVQDVNVTGLGPSAQIDFSQGRSGAGVRIAVCDDGFDVGHPDFALLPGDGYCSSESSGRLYADVYATEGVESKSGHATHVASIAAGNGSVSWNHVENGVPVGAFALRGHAPRACVGNYPATGSTLEDHHAAIVKGASNVLNHSYDLGTSSIYGVYERDLDSILRGDESYAGDSVPPRPQVWTAGNHGVCDKDHGGQFTGYFSVRNSSKNAIVVGSVDLLDNPPVLSQFSCLGPTLDQRLKPDLVAPGAFDSKAVPQDCFMPSAGMQGILAATVPTGESSYGRMSGTSMSAPAVTGVLALIMEELQAQLGILPETLRPSTYRALLIQTAADLEQPKAIPGREIVNPDTKVPVVYHEGPDHATGWGLVDAQRAVERVASPESWVEDVFSANAQIHEYCLHVYPGTEELRLTLAWDDAPGPDDVAAHEPRLVNDLDLTLSPPDGPALSPWTLSPLDTSAETATGGPDPATIATQIGPAERGPDDRNNVEVVSVPWPSPGKWRVLVEAKDLTVGETQHYSLVASQALESPCFPLAPPPKVVVDICSILPFVCDLFERPEPVYFVDPPAWSWSEQSVLPIAALRTRSSLPLRREGPVWERAPGYALVLYGVPSGALALVFDDRREIRARSTSEGGPVRIDVPPRPVGERHYLALGGVGPEPVNLNIRLVEVE